MDKTQVVHITRPSEPVKPVISEATKLKHDRSKQLYPNLNLSDGEYVISAVRRHPIGMFVPFILGIFFLVLSLTALVSYDQLAISIENEGGALDSFMVTMSIVLFIILDLVVMYIVYHIYTNNRFFLTNESIIQETQTSLFSRHEQTVSLSNIEDASYRQDGVIEQIVGYGSIRLSTEGDETSYRFDYVTNPKDHITKLNNAVEAFKNGRPVEE